MFPTINKHNNHICNECFKKLEVFKCECCETMFTEDHKSTVDEHYCSFCFPENRILNYSYKPYKTKFIIDDNDKCAMGIEFEIGGASSESRCLNVVKTFTNGHYVYFKKDGSIPNYGFEIVSHPANMNAHKNILPWNNIFSELKKNNIQSYDNCGIHAHFSRKDFNNTQIAVLDCLINTNYEFFEKLCGRKFGDYCKISNKRSDSWGRANNDRYLAVNLENNKTVELRFCASTNNYDTFIDRLELFNSIVKFCLNKNISIKDIHYNCGSVINDYINFCKENYGFAQKIDFEKLM